MCGQSPASASPVAGLGWRAIARRLEPEWRRFDGLELAWIYVPWPRMNGDLSRRLQEREGLTRERLDAAVRRFAGGGTWPKLSNDELCVLEARLFHGWLLAGTLAATGRRLPGGWLADGGLESDWPGAIEWLLIDTWPFLGFPLWLANQVERYAGIHDAHSICSQ